MLFAGFHFVVVVGLVSFFLSFCHCVRYCNFMALFCVNVHTNFTFWGHNQSTVELVFNFSNSFVNYKEKKENKVLKMKQEGDWVDKELVKYKKLQSQRFSTLLIPFQFQSHWSHKNWNHLILIIIHNLSLDFCSSAYAVIIMLQNYKIIRGFGRICKRQEGRSIPQFVKRV